jgi:hypothetical protein
VGDVDEFKITTILNNSSSLTAIPNLLFNPASVGSFFAYITVNVKRSSGSDYYHQLFLKGVNTDSDGMIIMSTTEQDAQKFGNLNNFYFFCNPLTGQISYTSGNYTDFVSATLTGRAWTTSK